MDLLAIVLAGPLVSATGLVPLARALVSVFATGVLNLVPLRVSATRGGPGQGTDGQLLLDVIRVVRLLRAGGARS